jgi:hypothetical protein
MFAAIAGAAMNSVLGKSAMSSDTNQSQQDGTGIGNFIHEGYAGPANIIGSILGRRHTQAAYRDYNKQLRAAMSGEQAGLEHSIGYLSPFQQHGVAAGTQELAMLQEGKDPAGFINSIMGRFQQSPAQRAAIHAGLGAAQSRLTSQGLARSGAEQKALENYAQQQTAGQYQQFLQSVLAGRQQTLGGLGQLGQLGLGAAQSEAQAQQQTAEDMAALRQSLGGSEAAAENAKGSEDAGIIGSVGNWLGSIF